MIVVSGEALFDFFSNAALSRIDHFIVKHGGSPYNVAVGLARLGAKTEFFSGISIDLLGEQIIAKLHAESVGTNYVARKEAPTTLSLVMLDAHGMPAYSFYGNNAADRALSVQDIPTFALPPSILHFGSYSLVCEPSASTYHTLAGAQAGRALISIDPNVRLTVEPDIALWRSKISEWAGLADVIKISREDLGVLYPGSEFQSIAQSWLDRSTALVVITDGDNGAVAFTKNHRVQCPAPRVEVVDTVGAGDAFQAALLYQLEQAGCASHAAVSSLSIDALQKILEFSCMSGALTCTCQGSNPPRLVDIAKALLA